MARSAKGLYPSASNMGIGSPGQPARSIWQRTPWWSPWRWMGYTWFQEYYRGSERLWQTEPQRARDGLREQFDGDKFSKPEGMISPRRRTPPY